MSVSPLEDGKGVVILSPIGIAQKGQFASQKFDFMGVSIDFP
jgi:hypothetical protein